MGIFYLLGLLLLLFARCFAAACGEESATGARLHTYLIHVRKPPAQFASHREWHESFLLSTNASVGVRLLYSYDRVFNGFAARLTVEELEAMKKMDGFVQAHPEHLLSIDTTHTPSFLGLYPTANCFWASDGGYGKGVIIGVLDTGISPTHPSFNDEGMGPPPSKWKGQCEFGNASLCNNKLIGARVFNRARGNRRTTPLDTDGHGTHVAGTSAGRFVENASVLGSASGTAAGMAPLAHLAMYKVCDDDLGCSDADVMAGIDSAVKDGVDVISMSLGAPSIPFYRDPVLIALLGAVKNGVLVSASAGNSGPFQGSIENDAPWILTVGAGTMNRRIRAVVRLGNGMEFEGESAYQPNNFSSTLLPLLVPKSPDDASCSNVTTLEQNDINGKIILCNFQAVSNVRRGEIVKQAGGAAMIVLSNDKSQYDTYANPNMIAASHVSFLDGSRILDYVNSTSNPTATIIFAGTQIGRFGDPSVAAFSSRGPSPEALGVPKPDVIGPGVNVLAAWHETVGPFKVLPPFNMISGTSMSCPHLSGIAALLKNAHPDWSPAMIKSAIMTTTDVINLNGRAIADNGDDLQRSASIYAMGAGHVNPVRANNPGLVYDILPDDYVAYLCSLGYTDLQVSEVAQSRIKCHDIPRINHASLNYPSLEVRLGAGNNFTQKAHRTLTNVGEPCSTYTLQVVRPSGVEMTVIPEVLNFTKVGQKHPFSVTFELMNDARGTQSPPLQLEGSLAWVSSNGRTTVRSPIAVTVAS